MNDTLSNSDTPATLAQPIVAHVHLLAIELMMASSARFPELDQRGNFNVPLQASDQINAVYHEQDRRVIAVVQLEVNAADDQAKLASWSAVYRLVYQVVDTYQGDLVKERAEAFCKTYSLAHAWPYWREQLASQCNKMGLPTVLAPIVVVGATPVVQPVLQGDPPSQG